MPTDMQAKQNEVPSETHETALENSNVEVKSRLFSRIRVFILSVTILFISTLVWYFSQFTINFSLLEIISTRKSIVFIVIALVVIITLLMFIIIRSAGIYEYNPIMSEDNIGSNVLAINCIDEKDREIAIRYYEYFRQEIEREDEITHQRVTWTMTFQGFIISAITLLLILDWGSKPVLPIGRLAVFVISFIGVCIGLISLLGITASRRSIRDAKEAWKIRNIAWGNLYPKYVPQAHGQGGAFRRGNMYAIFMAVLFTAMWAIFFCGYIFISYVTWIEPCLKGGDVVACMFAERPAGAAR
ncbi:MAG: hypothetical protein AB7P20_03110 [Rhizobiaceae bacterium]